MLTMVWEKAFRLILSLVWVAYFSRYLGPEEFGVYSYIFAIITMVSTFPLFGMENVMIKAFVNNRYDLIKSAICLRVVFSFFGAVLVFLICFFSDIKSYALISLFSLLIFLSLLVELIKNFYQSKERSNKYVFIDNVALIFSLLIKFILLKNEYISYPLFISLDFIIPFLFISSYFFRTSKFEMVRIDFKSIISLAKSSFPFFISTLMVVIYSKIDQVMIKELIGFKDLGYYSAALRISSSWWVVPTTITLSLFPVLIRKHNENNHLNVAAMYFSVCSYITLFLSFSVYLLADFLVNLIFGYEYINAVNVVQLHCFVGCLAALGVARSKWLVINNLQKWLPLFIFSGLLTNVILNFFLINKFGVNGAVYATIAAQITVLLIVPFMIKDTRSTVLEILNGMIPRNFIQGLQVFFIRD